MKIQSLYECCSLASQYEVLHFDNDVLYEFGHSSYLPINMSQVPGKCQGPDKLPLFWEFSWLHSRPAHRWELHWRNSKTLCRCPLLALRPAFMLKLSALFSTSSRIFKIDLCLTWGAKENYSLLPGPWHKMGNFDFSVQPRAHPFKRDVLLKVMQTAWHWHGL